LSSEKKVESDAKSAEEEKMAAGIPLLLQRDVLLSSGIQIGTRIKTAEMEQFIFRVRPDGLFVLDLKKTDERIRAAAKFIAQFEPSKIMVVSARLYGKTPVKKFCEVTKATPIIGRFLPGLFSNPAYSTHIEPNLVIVTDPKTDLQAINESAAIGVPVIALCDTDNSFTNIDFVIPVNNKGKRALATVFWLLARQVLRERGEIGTDEDLSISIDDFETKLAEIGEIAEEET